MRVRPCAGADRRRDGAALIHRFTAFNNRFFNTHLNQPIASLTVQVYTYAMSPYADWPRQAWAGALVLVSIVLVCSILARLATRRLETLQTP